MESLISVDEISVTCNFQIGQLKQLSIKEQMGFHTAARIVAEIKSGSLQIAHQQLQSQPLMIEAVKNGKRMLLFSGVISEIHIDSEALYETVSIAAYSLSWFMDLEKKSRSFQGEHSILDLIQKICRENSFLFLCSAKDKETEAPFIQYRETDWEFLLRLSSHLHAPVCAANDYENKGIYLGIREQSTPVTVDALSEKWCMDAERFKSVDFDVRKASYYDVTGTQVLHIGQKALYHNQPLCPFEVNMVLQQGVLYCNYKLAGTHYHTIWPCYNPYLKGVSFEGTVLERKEERIKVHLDIDDAQDINRAHFYPWLPEHGNMVYCMPEEGSKVRLLITGEDERDAIGFDCVRRNGEMCKETQMTDNRWFITNENKKLTLLPSFMELSGQEGGSVITFQDSIGNDLRSCENILIQAKGDIVMQGIKVRIDSPLKSQ